MEIIIATIATALVVTLLVVFGISPTVTRPVETKEYIRTGVERCIYDSSDNSLECILTNED